MSGHNLNQNQNVFFFGMTSVQQNFNSVSGPYCITVLIFYIFGDL